MKCLSPYFCFMFYLDNTIISDDIRHACFCCDLSKCKGACCVEGDGGAPLEEEEISKLEDYIREIKTFMTPDGIEIISELGVFDYDEKGDFVTPLIKGKECAYVYFENGVTRCAIEKAFQEKTIPFQKPISCHLYPVRISKTSTGETVKYHKWSICKKAVENGTRLNLRLYQFLEEPLIRKYGRSWYNRLVKLFY